MHEVIRGHGLLLHGSAGVRRGRAYLFLAPPGGGKSTLAGLFDEGGLPVLADEFALLLEKDRRFYVRPLARQSREDPARVPMGEESLLRKVFFLAKARDPDAVPLTSVAAVARTLKEFAVFGFERWSPAGRLAALDRLMRLFRTVPAYILHFARDDRFWEVIDEIDRREEAGDAPA
ncbi:MAG: hypothetical protein ACYSU0_09590 [Planctomycetota bacterium]